MSARARHGLIRALAVTISCGAVMAACAASDPPPPPIDPIYTLDDWMTVSSVGEFVWSPDGRYIYYTSNDAESGTYEIFRIALAGGAPELLSVNGEGVRPEPREQLTISPDGRTLYFASARYFQSYHNIYRMPADGGPSEALTFNDAVIETGPAPSPDGRTLAYFARTSSGAKIFLRDLDGAVAWPRQFTEGDAEERSPAWSPDGQTIAFLSRGDIWLRPRAGGAARRVVEGGFQGGNGSFAWSPDGTRIAFVRSTSGYGQIGVLHVASGRITPITHSANEHGDVSWSPDGRQLVFVRNDDIGMSQDVIVAPADGSGPHRNLTAGRPKGTRSSPQFSPDGRQVAFIESTGVRTRDIWLVPAEGGEARQLTNSMGKIDPAALSVPEEVFYPSTDSLPIPAILWKPKNFDPSRKYPVLVRLHGHPGQWNHRFEMMAQYFVERGFVAIAPNPRGSRGFGQGFHDLHVADYGGMEFEDIMNVRPFLEQLGYVDMSRKATWGGSGGGYMSFVIATKAPTAFQAQVIRAPVSDWKLLAIDRFGASGIAWTAGRVPRREREEFGGSYDEIPDEYDARSPINFVENVRVPQLLLQGLRDSSVPPRQSRVWVQRMRELGKSDLLTYVEYPHEDHSLRRYKATVRDRLERMSAFLAEHLRLPALAQR